MEYTQPWAQQRPSARPGGFRQNAPLGNQRTQQPGIPGQSGIGTLSREERQEAKRLAEEANFSFAGYQVVRREFISHRFDPAMTIRGNSITFNNSCISKTDNGSHCPHSERNCGLHELTAKLYKLYGILEINDTGTYQRAVFAE